MTWGHENSEYNLNSDHYDLDKLVLHLVWGHDPADENITNEEAIELLLDFYSDQQISLDNAYHININALNPNDKEIAWNAIETFALLTGHGIAETDAREDPSPDPDEDFATIYFNELPKGTLYNGIEVAGLSHTSGSWGINGIGYRNSHVEVVSDQDTGYKKSTYIHEIAHTFGITGIEDSNLDPTLDNIRFTAVSYNSPFGTRTDLNYLERTPMIADILAINLIWGLADEILHDDTTYGRGANTGMSYDLIFSEMAVPDNRSALTIMDTGGYDTLDFSDHDATSHGQPLRINMNPYWTSDVYSTQGNFIIGPDTWIEAAIGGPTDDHITGNVLDNVINGNAGDDTILAGPGDDVLQGGPGNDHLDGGEGLDVASYADRPGDLVITFDESGLFGDAFVSIEGLRTGTGNDTLIGNDNDNILEGGPGADTLTGKAGQDTASYLTSTGPVIVRLHNSTAQNNDAEGDTFTADPVNGLPDIENLTGSRHNDVLAGDSRDNVLRGKAGNDKIYGGPGGGDDTLAGGEGHDKLYGGIGDDTLDGGPGNDLLTGGPGADILIGGAGIDTAVLTGPGPVTVRLHNGTIAGNTDTIDNSFGQLISHTYQDPDGTEHSEQVPDIENLTGTAFNDILAGDARHNTLTGLAGDDTLYGGPGGGDDMLNGGTGQDRLFGGQGNDTLIGGPGDDHLAGGAGADIFVFSPDSGNDQVIGFNPDEDMIRLDHFDLPEEYTPDFSLSGADTLLSLAAVDGGEITFEDTQLGADDVVFIS